MGESKINITNHRSLFGLIINVFFCFYFGNDNYNFERIIISHSNYSSQPVVIPNDNDDPLLITKTKIIIALMDDSSSR